MSKAEEFSSLVLRRLLAAPAGVMTYATRLAADLEGGIRFLVACWEPGSTQIDFVGVDAEGRAELWGASEVVAGRTTGPVVEAIVEAAFLRANQSGGTGTFASIFQGPLPTRSVGFSSSLNDHGRATVDVFRLTRVGEEEEEFDLPLLGPAAPPQRGECRWFDGPVGCFERFGGTDFDDAWAWYVAHLNECDRKVDLHRAVLFSLQYILDEVKSRKRAEWDAWTA